MIKYIKLSLVLLGLLLIALSVYGCWKINTGPPVLPMPLIKINPDPEIDMSEWIIYQNNEYGFEFKYPVEWDFELKGENALVATLEQIDMAPGFKQDACIISPISFYVTYPDELPSGSDWPWRHLKKKSLTIGGLPGTQYEGFEDPKACAEYFFISEIFILKGDYLYNFSYRNEGKKPLPEYFIFKQILLTIRFVDS